MKHRALSLLKFAFIFSFTFLSIDTGWAQQSENQRSLEKGRSADFFLQKGHEAKYDGDIEKAIVLYKKALDVDPNFLPAKRSLESASSMLELTKWALKSLPAECRTPGQHVDTNISIKCAEEYFSITGQPIHPKIIQALSTWLSDGGDQIVAINLYESQHSNRFCCEDDIKIRKTPKGPIFYVSEDNQEFGYRYIGKTKSDIHVIYTYDWGGGSGIFTTIMLLTIEQDYGIDFDEKNLMIKMTRPRLLLKKLGEISLGDRWNGDLIVDGDNILIGKDKGWFSDRKTDNKDRVIKIDIST